jgi:hypothetical protein
MNNSTEDRTEAAPNVDEKVVRKTIYIDAKILKKGEERAQGDDRSFSNYVVQLIKRDVATVEPVKEAVNG